MLAIAEAFRVQKTVRERGPSVIDYPPARQEAETEGGGSFSTSYIEAQISGTTANPSDRAQCIKGHPIGQVVCRKKLCVLSPYL